MTINYSKILDYLGRGNKILFDIPVAIQYNFLRTHRSPKNDIWRSFFQYKAQMLFVSIKKRLLFNLLSLFILPTFLLLAFLKRITIRYKYNVNAIIEKNTHSGVIPHSLNDKYDISSKEWNTGWSLGTKDIIFLLKLFPLIIHSPYFVFKISYKISLYSTMIKSYRPKAIIVFNEYSFTSSALTYYCENNDIKHIDVMHGEKLFYIRDSFFRFSNTYVWEPYYIDLFINMNAPREQFIAELPPFMSINPSNYLKIEYCPDFTYYLANFNENDIKNIVSSMKFAKLEGKTVMYRPHPRYSNIDLLRKYVDESNIEYPESIDIMASVAKTGCAVGLYTTVLNQAFHAGKKVLIDDINFPYNYNKLKELSYSLMAKPIQKLSSYQK